MRTIIRPVAAKIGITQHVGWHTFRHTYCSLLRANKTDIKVTQELLRHASSRVTLDTYTQELLRSDGLRAESFAFCGQPPQRRVEAGLLGAVPSLCLLEMARSVLKHWLFIEVRSG